MYFLIMLTRVFVVLCVDPVIQDLQTPLKEYGEGCGYEGCPSVKKDMLNVHIVPHTHSEVGSSRTFYEHYTGYDEIYEQSTVNMKRTLDYIITELWAQPERKFTLSDTAFLFHWWENRDATVHRMVYQLLRQGRLQIVGGGWGMVDETCTSYHGIIDQFTYAFRKINVTFGMCGRPLVAWQADSFGHSREFTSLAALLAYDGLFVNPISFEDELQRMRGKRLEVLWRGSDDLGPETDMFTHKLFDGYWSPPGFCFGTYCADPLLVESDFQFRNIDERVDLFLSMMKNRQSPHYGTNHVMVVMGKRFGYHDASVWFENIDRLIANVNAKSARTDAKVHLTYSAPACYLRAVHESNPVLPIKQDDFMPVSYDKDTHLSGVFTSRPTIKYMVREGHVYLQMARQLQVLAQLYNNDETFELLNWVMAIMQDHNIITGSMRPHVKNYYTQKMYHAVQKSTLVLKQAFNKLRKSPSGTIYYRCAFNMSSCRNTNSLRSFIVIYNPLAWPVSIPVRLPVLKSRYTVFNQLLETVNSVLMKIPDCVLKISTRKSVADHEIVFMAVNIPPMGFRSYYIEINNPDQKKRRSVIKKLYKHKKKKYLARPKNHLKIDDEGLLETLGHQYDVYYDESVGRTTTELSVFPNDMDFHATYSPTASKMRVFGKPHIEEKTDTPKTRKDFAEPEKFDISENIFNDSTYFYRISHDKFISNKYINVKLDNQKQVVSVELSNGVRIALNVRFYYYASDDPARFGRVNDTKPGANVFKLMDPKPVLIKNFVKSKVYKTNLVNEVQTQFADWAAFTIRVYEESPVIDVDWVVGPIPIDDEIGKDVFVRYETDLINKGAFYTDSNGRQTVKRVRNDRPTYEQIFPDSIPGNFYPVTSKIYIEDTERDIRFSVFNDRAQGGASLKDGQIDLMVHRRILTDDMGVQCILNDTELGEGIVVRGRHHLYLSRAKYKPNKMFEKKFAKEIELSPQILVSPFNAYGENSKAIWVGQINEYSGVTKRLPAGVHVLTLQEWRDGTLLLRLENYLEKADVFKSGVRRVYVKNLFTKITVKSVRETTLGANIWLKDWVSLRWNSRERFATSFNDFYRANRSVKYSDEEIKEYEDVDIENGIYLRPQQIRTFVVWFIFHK